MAKYEDLTPSEQRLFRELFLGIVEVVATGDVAGHVPNCGYTEDHQICGCGEMGVRLREMLVDKIHRLA